MANCGICMKPLKQKKTLTCCKCGKEFHCTCLDLNKAKMERITASTWKCINCPEQKRKRRRVDVDGQEGKLSLEDINKRVFKIEANQKRQEESFNRKIDLLNENLDSNTRLITVENDTLNGIFKYTDILLKRNIKLSNREDVLSAVKEIRKAFGMDVVYSMFDVYHRRGNRTAHNSIYVNEDLTPARRRLLGTGRLLKGDSDDRYQYTAAFSPKEDLCTPDLMKLVFFLCRLPLSWREFSDSELFSYVAHTRSTFLSSFLENSSFAACLTNCTIVPDGLPQFSLFPTLCQASTIESEMFKSSAFLPLSLYLLYLHFFHRDIMHSECDVL
ncbi:hypothetical protein J6590_094882 [Homalodisca vitripennis]|nr:hypothetical protein J6590_094882 [Homalodisca vitripennis]